MSFDIQQLLRPAAPPGRGPELPRPRDAGFAQAFSDLLVGKDLVDPAAIGRARRAAEAASERFDLVLVKLGLISEADLCLAYATYCGLPLIEPAGLPARPVLADRLQVPFLKTNRILPISFDGRRLLIATSDPFVDEIRKGHQLHARRARRSRGDCSGGNRARLADAVSGRGVRDAV
ncbi:hypothetical protein ACF1BQ_004885 [Bradyrhizobium sp. RDT10]